MVKEFVLITMMAQPMVYTDKGACEEAAQKLQQHDSTAICIPAGKPQQDNMMDTFIDLVIKLESLGVDSVNK